MMRVGVVIFPGSNCDTDFVKAIQSIEGLEAVKLWHKSHDLQGAQFICLPGGFSYGDYLRAGALAIHSPIMQEVVKFAQKGGAVLGVCNGFQILCEAGLLPGALTKNNSGLFVCKKVFLKTCTNKNPLNKFPLGTIFDMSIAHAEGNYYALDSVLQDLVNNEQILFKYCSSQGQSDQDVNPNGSLLNIAGICNVGRNVIGLMPHPERSVSTAVTGSESGKLFLEGIINLYR